MAEAKTVNAADLELIHANISKTMAETMKLGAETAKIQAEQRYYPMVALGAIVVGALGAGASIIAGVIKLAY
ncbi:hypothetical protein [Luteibacter aegosomatissinici]|uniref:hypothetical protein n=1 Tax=Luteibacter aegosomatissinici TaxID=2911539 RepID=UPI001FF80E28|nr:hypothetical protein [Luteibacter aegosomatissinici]UPG93139.1 hypothetical protein L2Y97_14845 [Luteibacter aegosomatissinici]